MDSRRALSLGLALLLAVGVMGWWGWRTTNRVNAVENALEASYQRAFFDMMGNMENIDSLMGKSLASGAEGQRIMTLTSAWHEAESARTNLGNMPLGMVNMMRSQQYLAQLGDFCYVLAEKQARGIEITEEEWQQLEQLHQETREIHSRMRDMMGSIRDQGFQWREMASLNRNQRLTPEARTVADGFSQMDERLRDEVPTLTYDGPFSDHMEMREPVGITGERISEAQARDIALEFVGLANETGFQVDKIVKARGIIPAYSITVNRDGQQNNQIAIDVSQQGGHVIYMVDSRIPQGGGLDLNQAIQRAEAFLQERGYPEMVTTGSIMEGNGSQVSITFVVQNDGVVIYPDMVKVSVALDNGDIVAFEARNFLMAHQERDLPEPTLTPEEAEARVSQNMDVQRTRLAVIPMSNGDERFCYEVRGKVNGDTYHVYINAETGTEEKILQLLETESGTRAM